MKKNLFAIIALFIAISTSAFTNIKTFESDLVWFQVDAYTGEATSPLSGVKGDEPPVTCPPGQYHCAAAISISQGEVTQNSNGTFRINSGVDITDQQTMDASRSKN